MTPEQAFAEADSGTLRPVYLVSAEEPYLAAEVLSRLRKAALAGAVPGLNDDQFNAMEHDVGKAIAAARTLPMMAKRRLVIVQRIEEWEPKNSTADEEAPARASNSEAFDRLLEYAKSPSSTTTLLLVGRGLDKRRKLISVARSEGWLVTCEPLGRADLPAFVEKAAARLGGRFVPGVADLVAELAGPELAAVADAVDRLCLYAGAEPITEEMVAENVVRLRTKSVWELVGAVGRRDLGAALAALDDVFDPNEAIRLVGLLAWSTRQLLRFEAAMQRGLSPADAAQQAGAPPFKARELAQQLRIIPKGVLPDWLVILTDMDRALKGGSKLPPKSIFEQGVVAMCRPPSATRPAQT